MYIMLIINDYFLLMLISNVFEQGSNGQIGLFWGIASDGSVVISENLELIKESCAKSFAPFPTGMSNWSLFLLQS